METKHENVDRNGQNEETSGRTAANAPDGEKDKLSRRALLSRAGAAGLAIAAFGVTGANVFADPGNRGKSVVQSVYGGDNPGMPFCATPVWHNVKEEGAAGNGTADDSPAIAALLGTIGAAEAVVYFPAGTYRLASNIVFGANVALIFDQGAILVPEASVVVTIAGALQAGLYRIFDGLGTIAGPIRTDALYPQWWGAKADWDHDDTKAINDAIVCANGAGGGKVFLPAGTYRLASPQGDNNALIVPMSNVELEGEGDSTVLKVANDLNIGRVNGWNVIFPPFTTEAYAVHNVSFRRFKVDCNGVNNKEESTRKHKNAAIGVLFGSNVTVDAVTVVQNAGRQCFTFGRPVSPSAVQTVTNLVVQNCYIDTVGAAVAGNTLQNDHSALYAAANVCTVLNNRFVNPDGGQAGATAFEMHSCNMTLANNIVLNFSTGINIVATASNHINCIYEDNIFKSVNNGIAFYCMKYHAGQIDEMDFVMDRVLVNGNLFETLGNGYPVVNLDTNVKIPIKSVVLTNNTIQCLAAPTSVTSMPGVKVGQVERTEIRGNRLYGLIGRAVEFGTLPAAGITALAIEDNDIVDCCRTTSIDSGYKKAIALNSNKIIQTLRINGNRIENTGAGVMTAAISGNAPLGFAEIKGNTVINVGGEVSWDNTVAVGSLYVDHIGSNRPESTVRASATSRWVNRTNGDLYVKKSDGNAATGWRLERYADAAPTSGSYARGDIVYNASPSASGTIGWVCTTAGSPGTFKAFGAIDA